MKKLTRPTAPLSKWPYPFVECSGHPGKQRGYVLCPHIILGQCRPVAIELATDTDLGSCLCGQHAMARSSANNASSTSVSSSPHEKPQDH